MGGSIGPAGRTRPRPQGTRGAPTQAPSTLTTILSVSALTLIVLFAAISVEGADHGRDATVALHLDPDLHLDNATYFVGNFAFDRELIHHPGVVDVKRLEHPPGALVVCPIEDGARGVLPSLAALGMDCPEGSRFEDAEISFGVRTWLRLEGTYRTEHPERVSVNLIAPEGDDGRPLWFTTPSDGGLSLQHGAESLRFSAMTGMSRVIVTAEDGSQHFYNGTGWGFVFENAGTSRLTGEGFLASLDDGLTLQLDQGRLEEVETAVRPRVFIDLQQLAHGADARESIGNATRHFSLGLVPHFQNGAILGNINGTVALLETDGSDRTLIRGTGFTLNLEGSRLEGTGDIHYILHDGSLWIQGQEVTNKPMVLIAVLWSVALITVMLGLPWRAPPAWQAWVERSLPLLAFVVLDRAFSRILEISTLDLLFSAAPLPWVLRMTTLMLVAFLLGWLLLYVPTRTILRRVSPERLRPFVPLVVFPVFLLYMWAFPGALIEMSTFLVRI
jgi:hypothetical protein